MALSLVMLSPVKLLGEHLWLSIRFLSASPPLHVMLCSAFMESMAEFLPPWYSEVFVLSSCGLENFGSSNSLFYIGASKRMKKLKQMFFLECVCYV